MKIRKSKQVIVFNIIAYITISMATIVCLLPFILIISGSLTKNSEIITKGYSLFPRKISLDAYKAIFYAPEGILDGYRVTGLNMIAGTSLGLFFMSMAGYVLQKKDFKYRNKISFFIYFTSIFGGGLVPWYIMIVKYFNLQDSYLAICLPGLMTPFLIILIRTFIKASLPEEVVESAKIDGAGEFKIYSSIVLPISVPGLVTVGLFLALRYWNGWYHSSLFITTPRKYELQYYLYNILNNYNFIRDMQASTGVSLSFETPSESVKLAMAIITTGPIILLYPFVQKYFVKGITIGAVKG